MTEGLFELPERPFFSCDEDGFAVVDGALMKSGRSLTAIEPVLKLRVGPNNIFEHRPRKVLGREGDIVSVECDGDVTVHLDFHDLAAKVQTAEGVFFYLGALEDGNEGKGFLAPR